MPTDQTGYVCPFVIIKRTFGFLRHFSALLGLAVALLFLPRAAAQQPSTAIPAIAATYGFNEGSGSTTADASSNANTATLYGASWTTAGRYGDALSFNGVSSYVEAPNSSSLNPATAATFSAWVNLAASNDISAVIDKWSQTADDEYLFGLDSSNRLIFAWQTTGGNVWGQPSYNLVSGTAQVPLGTWTYISVVRNGPSISFYINGNIDVTYASAADANPFRSGINTLRIAGQNRGGVARFLNGTIDEVRMYNQARTQAQIQSDMNTSVGSSTLPSPPSITSQPTNQTVQLGQAAAFSVGATGTAPLSYQWQKNGVNISGATAASYTTPAATTVDSGSTFRVLVSNTTGSVTSSAATLTVNPAPAPAIQVSRSSISFGNDAIGTTLSQVLIITNTGTATLSMTQVTESGASAFSVSGFPLPVNVNPGQQTTITVAFLPTSTGPLSGNISIVSNAPTSPTSVALTGTGIAATLTLNLSSTSLSFGNVTTGTSSAPQTVTITNTGNSNVTISQITLSGAGYSITGGSAAVTLTPTQSITVSVLFSPAVAGTVNGGLSIVSNASGSPANVSLSGTGVATVQHSVKLNWTASASVSG
ncbi:MAG TPA: choice-of-anchor D domain-containing protein, partial [Terriglobales bacterium]|nr:choice-of-anchor D domain-containing protein [Terriglobales bacterium]